MSETNPPYAPHMMYPTMMPPAMMMPPSYHWHPAARDDEWNKLYTVHRQLIVEMEKLKGERDEQETRLDNLAEEMHDTAKDRIEMADEIEQLERKNDQLVVEMNELRSERDQMKSKLKTNEDESKAAMGQLQIEVDQLRTELHLLKANNDQLKADKDQLKANNDLLKAEKDQLTAALKTQEDESKAAIRQLQAALDRASAAERDRVEETKSTADQRVSNEQNAKNLLNPKTFKDSVLKGTWATAAAANPSANPAVTQADGNFQLVMGKRAIRNQAPPRPAFDPAVVPLVEPAPAVVEPAPVEPAVEPTPADPTSATKALKAKKHEAAEQAKRAAKKKAEEDDRILAAALAEKKNAPPPTSEKTDGSQLKDLRRKELIRKARLQASLAPDLPAGLLRRPKKTAPNAEYVKAAENVLALTRECLAGSEFPVPVEISLHYGRGMKAIYTLRRSETQCLHFDADNVHLLQDALRDPAQWQQLLADLENGAAAAAPALSKKGLLHAYVGEMDDALDFVLAKGEME